MLELTFIAVTYKHTTPVLNRFISSLQLQTDPNFHCYIINDGPFDYVEQFCIDPRGFSQIRDLSQKLNIWGDDRFKIIQTPKHTGMWGHHNRKWAIENLDLAPLTHLTNADNLYLPTFVEKVVNRFNEEPDTQIVLNNSLHNYFGYTVFEAFPRINECDFVNFTVKTDLLRQVGFNHPNEFAADGLLINELAAASQGKISKIEGSILSVHC